MRLSTTLFVAPVIALLSLALGACGGSSSSSSSTPTSSASGTVTLLIADGPIDEFDQAIIDVSQIILIADDDNDSTTTDQVLLNTPIRVDLLQLQNVSELIADGVSVPAGTYSKIRLEVTSIMLNKVDAAGNVIPGESVDVEVPSSGKIDLNPRGDLVVSANGDLVLQIDIDLESSVKRNDQGELRFRPVVFIDRIDDDNSGRLTRLYGLMRNIDATASSLDLCNARRLSSDDENDILDRCVAVILTDDTKLLDGTGEAITVENLANGDAATVYGPFRQRAIVARILEVGERREFSELEGIVQSLPNEAGEFAVLVRELEHDDLEVDEGSIVTVVLADGVKLFGEDDDSDRLLEPAALAIGDEIEARGVFSEDDEGNLRFKAFMVHIEDADRDDDDTPDVDEEIVEIVGLLDAVDLLESTLTVVDDDGTAFCVRIDEHTDFFRITEDGEATSSSEISANEIAGGFRVEVSGELEDDGCIEARDVVLNPDAP